MYADAQQKESYDIPRETVYTDAQQVSGLSTCRGMLNSALERRNVDAPVSARNIDAAVALVGNFSFSQPHSKFGEETSVANTAVGNPG